MSEQRIAVVGAGTMGSQIAQQIALHGYSVSLYDERAEQLAKALESNRAHLQRRVEKGTLAPLDFDAALARVEPFDDLASCRSTAVRWSSKQSSRISVQSKRSFNSSTS